MPTESHALVPRSLVDRSALFVLESMLRARDVRSRRVALRKVDPLVRSGVDRRITSLLEDLGFEFPNAGESHRLCLAILTLVGIEPTDPSDEAGVTEQVASLAKPSGAPFWGRSLAVFASLVAAGLVAAGFVLTRPKPYEELSGSSIESARAFVDGGRPIHREAIDESLPPALTSLVVAVDAMNQSGSSPDAEFRRVGEAIRAPELVRALRPRPASALERLVTAYVGFVRGQVQAEALERAIRGFDEACVEAGLGYRVDAFPVRTGVVALVVHSIESVVRLRVGNESRRILLVERLDQLNVRVPLLGFSSGTEGIVALGETETFTVSVVLPLLEDPPRLTLMSPSVSLGRYPWMTPTHESASSLVARSLVSSGCRTGVDALVRALAARRSLFERWSVELAQHGISVEIPTRYRLDVDALEERAGSRLTNLRDLVRVQDELASAPASRAFRCVRDAIATELATQIVLADAMPAPPADEPRAPSIVATLDPGQTQSPEVFRADPGLAEVRASLVALARGPSPGLFLVGLLRCYTHGGSCTRAREVATVITIAELARERHVPSFVEPDRTGATAVAAMFRDLAPSSDAELRAAATTTYRRLFGREPPSLDEPR